MSGAVNRARRISADSRGSEGEGDGSNSTIDGDDNGTWCVDISMSDEEIIKEIKNFGGGGEIKKDLIRKIMPRKDELANRIKVICPHLSESFGFILPETVASINKYRVVDIDEKIFKIHVILREFLTSENTDGGRHTRLIQFVQEIENNLSGICDAAQKAVSDRKRDAALANIVKLNKTQKQRKYLENGSVPTNEAFRFCPFCAHGFVDDPDTNKDVHKRNREELEKHNEVQKAYKNAIDTGKQYIHNGNVAKKCPRAPKPEDMYLKCHCSEFWSPSLTNLTGSTCPIRCLNDNTGERYEKDVNGMNTCPICICPCDKAFLLGAHQVIRHKERMLHPELLVKKQAASAAQKQKEGAKMMFGAIDSTFEQHFGKKMEELPTHVRPTGDNLAHLKDEIYERTSHDILAKSNVHEDQDYIRMLQTGFGAPTTHAYVVRPGGHSDVFDTRALSSRKSNHRAENNRLLPSIANSSADSKPAAKDSSKLRPHRHETSNMTPPPSTLFSGFVTPAAGSNSAYAIAVGSDTSSSDVAAPTPKDDKLRPYDRVFYSCLKTLQQNTIQQSITDVDEGIETLEQVENEEAELAGRRLRWMSSNEDVASTLLERVILLEDEEDPMCTQELTMNLDSVWASRFSPAKRQRGGDEI